MQVTKLTAEQIGAAPKKHQYSEEEMQREYHYIRAEQMTKKLLIKGLITEEEYGKIMVKNRQVFSPFLSDLYPQELLITQGFRGNMSPTEEEVS